MKKIFFALCVSFFSLSFLCAATHTYDKIAGYSVEWNLDDDQEIELQELLDNKLHSDGIYVERAIDDSRYTFKFLVDTDFGKNALEKKMAKTYDVSISYNIKSKSGVITIKSDLKNPETFDVQLSKILTDLWKPLCFEKIDQSCILPVKDRVRFRSDSKTLEFHYHPKG